MNLENLCINVFEQLGEPSDLLPGTYDSGGQIVFDATTSGALKLIDWVNRGYKRIIGWKFKDGRILRFDVLTKEVYFKSTVKTGTLTSGAAGSVVLPVEYSATDSYYNGWVLYISGGTGSGQTRGIVKYTGSTLTAIVNEDFDTAPDGTSTFEMYKAFYDIVESTDAKAAESIVVASKENVMTVIKLTDMVDKFDLGVKERTEQFSGSFADTGIPSTYWTEGYKIRFDSAPNEERWYKFKYMGLPADLMSGTDIPEIPSNWHEGIILWAVQWGLRRERHWQGAYSTKMDLTDFMETTKRQADLRGEEEEIGLEVVLR